MAERFNPAPNETINLSRENYVVLAHPSADGLAFCAEGKRAAVYNLTKNGNGASYALKVFKAKYRNSSLMDAAQRLKQFKNMPGMLAAQRTVVEPSDSAVTKFPELVYSMLMVWVGGTTWYDVLTHSMNSGAAFDTETAFALCRQFISVMVGLERAGVAHTDISPGNLSVSRSPIDVQLLDLEDIYIVDSLKPKEQNKGSKGYNHPSADNGQTTCSQEGDRYATAVLASEMLLAADSDLSYLASDTGFYGGNRGSESGAEAFREAYPYLRSVAPAFSALFEKAWNSPTLADCPKASELESAIGRDVASLPKAIPGVQWIKPGTSPHPSVSRAAQASWAAGASSSGHPTADRQATPNPRASGSAPVRSSAPNSITTPGVSWRAEPPSARSSLGTRSASTSGPQISSSHATAIAPPKAGPVGVGGWLALFVFGLIVMNPLGMISNIAAALKFSNLLGLLLSISLAGLSIFAGVSLLSQRTPRAVRITKWFLGFVLVYGFVPILVAISLDLPQEIKGVVVARAFGEFFAYLIYAGIWFLYLINSKRVFATFGTN